MYCIQMNYTLKYEYSQQPAAHANIGRINHGVYIHNIDNYRWLYNYIIICRCMLNESLATVRDQPLLISQLFASDCHPQCKMECSCIFSIQCICRGDVFSLANIEMVLFRSKT